MGSLSVSNSQPSLHRTQSQLSLCHFSLWCRYLLFIYFIFLSLFMFNLSNSAYSCLIFFNIFRINMIKWSHWVSTAEWWWEPPHWKIRDAYMEICKYKNIIFILQSFIHLFIQLFIHLFIFSQVHWHYSSPLHNTREVEQFNCTALMSSPIEY